MNGNLEMENNGPTNISDIHRLEVPKGQAKITGLLCIGCAIIAVLFAILSLILLPVAIFPYFVFLLLSAAFGLAAYSETKVIGSSLTSSIFQLLSFVLFIFAFLSIPGKKGYTLGIFFFLIETFVPVTMIILALISNKAVTWKALIPLAVPISLVVSYPLFKVVGFLPGALLLPLSWSLLGIIAYRGRGNSNAALLISDKADLFDPLDANSTIQPKAEISDGTLRRNSLIAVTTWCLTTIIKIGVLYSLRSRTFPGIGDVLLIISPMIIAAVAALKSKRWYRILFADSIVMILVFVAVLFINIALTLNKKGIFDIPF